MRCIYSPSAFRTSAAIGAAFAPKDDPKVAIAVTVERTQGQGGTVAAPIAKQVMEALIGAEASG